MCAIFDREGPGWLGGLRRPEVDGYHGAGRSDVALGRLELASGLFSPVGGEGAK
jgi:hypothetical protein